jgi:predicted secreted protein
MPDPTRPSRSVQRQRLLREQLTDARSGRVLVVSHCLLNENVRYLGGAAHPGPLPQILHAALDHDLGLVQMPCPEQHAWGGVLKTHMLALYGSGGRWAGNERLRRPVSQALTTYTRRRLTPLAARVAQDLSQYRDAGMDVVAVVGVGSSPSCGVTCTMDLDRALGDIAGCPLQTLTRTRMTEIVTTRTRPGPGIFTTALQAALRRRRVRVPFVEHDLRAEPAGNDDTPAALQPLLPARP